MANLCLVCSAELPAARRAGGQRRLYCSPACRSAAWRRRRASRDLFPNDELQRLVDFTFIQDDPIEAAAEIIVMLRATARRASRLAPAAPPQLAWRHEQTAQLLRAYPCRSPAGGREPSS